MFQSNIQQISQNETSEMLFQTFLINRRFEEKFLLLLEHLIKYLIRVISINNNFGALMRTVFKTF